MTAYIARYYDYDNEDCPIIAASVSWSTIMAVIWDRYGGRISVGPFHEADEARIMLDEGRYGAKIIVTKCEIEVPES